MSLLKAAMLPLLLLIEICMLDVAVAADVQDQIAGPHEGFNYRSSNQSSIAGGDGLPSRVRGIGTYAGGISAVRFKRNGLYFAVEGGSFNRWHGVKPATAGPRVIHIDRKTIGDACSYEAGVCVIRP